MKNKKIDEKFEQACLLLTEALENRYCYDTCVKKVSISLKLDNMKIVKIRDLVSNFDWRKDQDYQDFTKNLHNIILS